jgi:hypothetical protein
MRIVVTRTGGFAGMTSTWDIEVEQQPDSREWEILIDTIPWQQPPPAPAEPDRYQYRIRCDPHDVTLAERQVTGPWKELVDRVKDTERPSTERGRRAR